MGCEEMLSSSVLFSSHPSSQVTPCMSIPFPVFVHFKNTEENSQLSPITENCYPSIHQVLIMLKEQRLAPLNLLNSFQKKPRKPLAPANPPPWSLWGLWRAMLGPRMSESPAELLRTAPRSDAGIVSYSTVRSAQTQDSLCFSFERICLLFPTLGADWAQLSLIIFPPIVTQNYTLFSFQGNSRMMNIVICNV